MADRTPTATDIIATFDLPSQEGGLWTYCMGTVTAELLVAALDAAGFDIVARTDLTRMTGDTSTDLRMLYAYEAGLRDGQSDADPAVCPTCGSDIPSDRYGGEAGSRCYDPFHTPGADQ